MRRIAFLLIGVALLWLGGRALWLALRSDEDEIRTRLEAACEGFGEARMNPILEFLSPAFVDETSGFHRDDVRAAIAGAFFQEKDPVTKGFPYRAAVVPDSLAIDVAARPEGGTAEVRFSVRITDTRGGEERTAWEFALKGSLQDGDDGWQLVRATHDTSSGNWKLR